MALPSPGAVQPSRGETSSTGDPLRVTPQRGGPSSHPCGRSRCSGAGGLTLCLAVEFDSPRLCEGPLSNGKGDTDLFRAASPNPLSW